MNHVLNIFFSSRIGPRERTLSAIVKWFLKAAFWFLIYLIGSYLTIRPCFNLFQSYSSNPISTRWFVSTGNGVRFPNITVCVPIDPIQMFPLNSNSVTPYSDAMNDFFLKHSSKDGNFKFKPYNYNVSIVNSDTLLDTESWQNIEYDPDNFTRSDLVPNEAMFVMQKYLAILYEAENLRTNGDNPFSDLLQQTGDEFKALLNISIPKIVEFNITIDQIKTVFTEFFRLQQLFHERIVPDFCYQRINQTNFCSLKISPFFEVFYRGEQGSIFKNADDKTITFWDQHQICLKTNDMNKILLDDAVKTKSFDFQITIYNNGGIGDGKITVDFGGNDIPSDVANIKNAKNIYTLRLSKIALQNIKVQAVNRLLPQLGNERRCSVDYSRQTCELMCRNDLIQQFCRCSPIMIQTAEKIGETETCTFERYEKCLNYSGNKDEDCRSKCVESCEQWQFEISEPRKTTCFEISGKCPKAIIRIKIVKFDYAIYEEFFVWTLEDFISAMSGALGLWFGLNFIVILRFVFYLFAIIFVKLRSFSKFKKRNSEQRIAQPTIAATTFKNFLTLFDIKGPLRFTWLSIIKWLIEKTFWMVIYTSGAILTAIFCFRLVQQYLSGSTHISMTINYNTSFSLPPAVVCIPVPPDYLRNLAYLPDDNEMSSTGSFEFGPPLGATFPSPAGIQPLFPTTTPGSGQVLGVPSPTIEILGQTFGSSCPKTENVPGSLNSLIEQLACATSPISLSGQPFGAASVPSTLELNGPSFGTTSSIAESEQPFDSNLILGSGSGLSVSNRKLNTIAITDYFNSTDSNRAEFLRLDNGSTWPIELTYIVNMFLGVLYNAETSTTPVNLEDESILQIYYDISALQEINNILTPKLVKWNISIAELRQKLGFELDTLLNFKANFVNQGTTAVINETKTRVIYFTPNTFNPAYCTYLPLDKAKFKTANDYIEISSTVPSGGFPGIILDFSAPLAFAAFDYISVRTQYSLYFMASVYVPLNTLSLRINSVLKNAPVANSPVQCAAETQEICQARVRIKLIEKICNCSPSTWPSLLTPNSRECSWEEYRICLYLNGTEDAIDKRKCLSPCELLIFDSNDYSQASLSSYFKDAAHWRIYVTNFIYPLFEEKPDMTFQDFIAAFGGMLGVILKIDFRIFPWIIFTPAFVTVTFIFKCKRGEKVFSKNDDTTSGMRLINHHSVKKMAFLFDIDLKIISKMSRSEVIQKSVEKIYWAIVHIVGGILTFQVCLDLFLQVQNDRIIANIQSQSNTSIFFPSPTVCVPLNSLKMDDNDLSPNEASIHSFLNIKSATANDKQQAKNQISLVQSLFANKTAASILNTTWNASFLQIVHMYVSKYGVFEMPDPDEPTYSRNIIEEENSADFFKKMDHYIDLLDIQMSQLIEKFGTEVRNLYPVEIWHVRNNSFDNSTPVLLKTTFVSKSKICYRSDAAQPLELKSVNDYLKIHINGTMLFNDFWACEPMGGWFPANTLCGTVTIDLKGRHVSSNTSNILDATISAKLSEITSAAMEITSIIQALPSSNGKLQCSADQSIEECESKCLLQAIEKYCKCAPRILKLVAQSKINELNDCFMANYSQCFGFAHNASLICSEKCLSLCEQIRLAAKTVTSQQENGQIEISLRMKSFTFQYIEEQLYYTTENLIGAFGGALALFIGLDFLQLVQFFFTIFGRLVDIICISKKWSKVKILPLKNSGVEDAVVEISL